LKQPAPKPRYASPAALWRVIASTVEEMGEGKKQRRAQCQVDGHGVDEGNGASDANRLDQVEWQKQNTAEAHGERCPTRKNNLEKGG